MKSFAVKVNADRLIFKSDFTSHQRGGKQFPNTNFLDTKYWRCQALTIIDHISTGAHISRQIEVARWVTPVKFGWTLVRPFRGASFRLLHNAQSHSTADIQRVSHTHMRTHTHTYVIFVKSSVQHKTRLHTGHVLVQPLRFLAWHPDVPPPAPMSCLPEHSWNLCFDRTAVCLFTVQRAFWFTTTDWVHCRGSDSHLWTDRKDQTPK